MKDTCAHNVHEAPGFHAIFFGFVAAADYIYSDGNGADKRDAGDQGGTERKRARTTVPDTTIDHLSRLPAPLLHYILLDRFYEFEEAVHVYHSLVVVAQQDPEKYKNVLALSRNDSDFMLFRNWTKKYFPLLSTPIPSTRDRESDDGYLTKPGEDTSEEWVGTLLWLRDAVEKMNVGGSLNDVENSCTDYDLQNPPSWPPVKELVYERAISDIQKNAPLKQNPLYEYEDDDGNIVQTFDSDQAGSHAGGGYWYAEIENADERLGNYRNCVSFKQLHYAGDPDGGSMDPTDLDRVDFIENVVRFYNDYDIIEDAYFGQNYRVKQSATVDWSKLTDDMLDVFYSLAAGLRDEH